MLWRSLAIYIVLILVGGETAATASREIASPSLYLSVQNQRLTAQIDQAPLRKVLEALTEQMPITITLMGFEGENALSESFTDLPLEEGIERLLQRQDYALRYARPDPNRRPSGQSRIVEIFVLPRQKPSSSTTSPETQSVMSLRSSDQTSPTDEKLPFFDWLERQAIKARDSSDRIAAIITIAEQQKDSALSVLRRASLDPDPEVRATALALLAINEKTQSEGLLNAALTDSDSGIRELAGSLLQEFSDPLK
jgi:hypothetical protein